MSGDFSVNWRNKKYEGLETFMKVGGRNFMFWRQKHECFKASMEIGDKNMKVWRLL